MLKHNHTIGKQDCIGAMPNASNGEGDARYGVFSSYLPPYHYPISQSDKDRARSRPAVPVTISMSIHYSV